ncbi:ELOV5 protein, partial [Polypterus senegalus]
MSLKNRAIVKLPEAHQSLNGTSRGVNMDMEGPAGTGVCCSCPDMCDQHDPRVRGWFLLDNYFPTFILSCFYFFVVWIGPKYMHNRQAFSCRTLLVLYNLGLTLLSLYMFIELVTGVWQGGYNFFCQDTHSGGEADMKIIRVLWWYYFSKLIEFMDTFFFILRKNNHQITILHTYHHGTMLNIWWFVMNWVPCGHCECLASSRCASRPVGLLQGLVPTSDREACPSLLLYRVSHPAAPHKREATLKSASLQSAACSLIQL